MARDLRVPGSRERKFPVRLKKFSLIALSEQIGLSLVVSFLSLRLTDFERRQLASLRKKIDREYETQSGLAKQSSKGFRHYLRGWGEAGEISTKAQNSLERAGHR